MTIKQRFNYWLAQRLYKRTLKRILKKALKKHRRNALPVEMGTRRYDQL